MKNKIEYINNELVNNLNSIFGKEYFIFTLCKIQESLNEYKTIADLIFTPTKHSILTIKQTVPTDEDIYDEVIKEFNKELLKNILFSLPTYGDIVDMWGREIKTFADCKLQILEK